MGPQHRLCWPGSSRLPGWIQPTKGTGEGESSVSLEVRHESTALVAAARYV